MSNEGGCVMAEKKQSRDIFKILQRLTPYQQKLLRRTIIQILKKKRNHLLQNLT